MKHLDLFSGIGGFALAARWVGWETVGFCEIEPYCQKVLRKHWPGVPIYKDVRDVTAERLKADGIGVDIITGGFPCQDISYAGKGAGIEGERSGLWTYLARIIGEVRPRYAVLENVAALLSRGLDRVAGDLAEIGYDCEWHCIPASAIGAPHRRDRIWIVAYPNSTREQTRLGEIQETDGEISERDNNAESCNAGESMADTKFQRPSGSGQHEQPIHPEAPTIGQAIKLVDGGFRDFWAVEPNVGRVANGVPSRVDRLKGLGNAIVPQVAEVIFRAINEAEWQ